MKYRSLFFPLFLIAAAFSYNLIDKDSSFNESGAFLEDEINNIKIYERSSDLIVNVRSAQYARLNFFSFNVLEVPAGSGSGFIWDNDGHIVTNYHVVRNADKLVITAFDGQSYRAEVKGVALRKILLS